MQRIETSLPGVCELRPKIFREPRIFHGDLSPRKVRRTRHHRFLRSGQSLLLSKGSSARPALSIASSAGETVPRRRRRSLRCRRGYPRARRISENGRASCFPPRSKTKFTFRLGSPTDIWRLAKPSSSCTSAAISTIPQMSTESSGVIRTSIFPGTWPIRRFPRKTPDIRELADVPRELLPRHPRK